MTAEPPRQPEHISRIVGVLACRAYADRMQACEDTWVPRLEAASIKVVFLIGNPELVFESRLTGRVLELRCGDGYRDLPEKTQRFASWAIRTHTFDHLFKCDDDTHINASAFVDYEVEGDYVGLRMPGDYASGGAGYFLSPRAAHHVAVGPLEHWAEDKAVGQLLAGHGIDLASSMSFHTCNPEWDGQPLPNAVTHHLQRLSASEMHRIDALIEAPPG